MSILINKTKVKKISGPVSMHILSPTDEYLERFPYAPILILFGDIHHGAEGFCKDDTSYKVYDINFLGLLNKAVVNAVQTVKEEDRKQRFIDFYVEGAELHKFPDEEVDENSGGRPMDELWNLFIKCCYNIRWKQRVILEKNKPTCDNIPNIRWQSGDIRFFFKEKEKSNIGDFLKLLIREILKVDSSAQVKALKAFLTHEMTNVKQNETRKQSNVFTKEEIIKEYLKNVLIAKQLNKIHDGKDSGDGENEYKKEFETRFSQYVNSYKHIDTKDGYYVLMQGINEDLQTFFSKSDPLSLDGMQIISKLLRSLLNNNNVFKYLEYITARNALLLDLYTLSRIYKTMIKLMRINPTERRQADGTPIIHPIINVCYFGKNHINEIADFLISTSNSKNKDGAMDYTRKAFKINENLGNRCIEIDSDYSLDDTIEQLIRKRITYEERLQKRI